MNRSTARLMSAAALLSAAVLAASCQSSSPPAGGNGGPAASSLTVELDWVPNPDHVGIYYAQNKGYFTKNHLNIHLQVPGNSADPLKLVGLSKVDLAISYESEMYFGQQAGLPVTAVAEVIPVPLNSLIVTPKDHVSSLSQMKGKTVGTTGIPSDNAIYATLLKKTGYSRAQVPSVTVGYNLVPSILAGKVDAIVGGYRNVEAIQIQQEMHAKPTVFPASSLGVPNFAELVLVANRHRLATDTSYAKAVRDFVRALVQGTNAAIADPAGATTIMQQVTQYKPEFLKVSVPFTLRLIASGGKTGCISVSGWQSFGNWMKHENLIHITPDAAQIATARYLPYSC